MLVDKHYSEIKPQKYRESYEQDNREGEQKVSLYNSDVLIHWNQHDALHFPRV